MTKHADFVSEDTSTANRISATFLNALNHLWNVLSDGSADPTSAAKYCDGRLSLETGVPVSSSDQNNKATIYFTPCVGDKLSLYDGTYWRLYPFTELSIAVPAVTGMNDLFVYNNSGTLTLEIVAWTNTTTRATALAYQNGVLCQSGALTHRYLGSYYSDTTVTDALLKRNLWNYYHRRPRPVRRNYSAATWDYTTATFRQVNAEGENQIEFVVGVAEDNVKVRALAMAANSTGGVVFATGVGLDSTSANSAGLYGTISTAFGAGLTGVVMAEYSAIVAVGWHKLVWLEYSAATGTTTWYGQAAGANSGLMGEVWA